MLNSFDSTKPRVTGGAWTKEDRFGNLTSQQTKEFSTVPFYQVPYFLEEHVRSPLMKAPVAAKEEQKSPKSSTARLPLSQDRSSFVYGSCKNDLMYYNVPTSNSGPCAYQPFSERSVATLSTKTQEPRPVIGREPKFQSFTKQFLSNELNDINLCTASPGPAYLPPKMNNDLVMKNPPSVSFGYHAHNQDEAKEEHIKHNTDDRTKFLNAVIKTTQTTVMNPHTQRPQTSKAQYLYATNVCGNGPASYFPTSERFKQRQSPRVVFSKSKRFDENSSAFVSKKHSKKQRLGVDSPGPIYYSEIGDTGLIGSKKPNLSHGKWCP